MHCTSGRWRPSSGIRAERRQPDPLVNSGVEVAGRNRYLCRKGCDRQRNKPGEQPHALLSGQREPSFSRFTAEVPSVPVDTHPALTFPCVCGGKRIHVRVCAGVGGKSEASQERGERRDKYTEIEGFI